MTAVVAAALLCARDVERARAQAVAVMIERKDERRCALAHERKAYIAALREPSAAHAVGVERHAAQVDVARLARGKAREHRALAADPVAGAFGGEQAEPVASFQAELAGDVGGF